jgi:alpha-L-fucosidase
MSTKTHSSAVSMLLVGLLGGALSCATASSSGETQEESPAASSSEAPAQQSDDLAWWRKSMEGRDQRTGWFRDARFGMFVHWGVYSTLGGVWQGQPVKGYAEHIQRIAKIPVDVYKDNVASHFDPKEFNADEWMATVKATGMKYFIITAKHHDGFAMFDSAVSDYNVVKATPWKRDPMKELREAAKKAGIHFGFYYSQAWDWEASGNAPGEGWKYPKSQGEKSLADDMRWMEQALEPAAKIRKYVDGKVIPQLKELVTKYQPEIFWFDTPSYLPVSENLRILKALREVAPNVVVNGRITQGTPGGPAARYGDYVSTTDKPADFPPVDGDWEGIPTTNESYAWHKEDNSHKPPEHFIGLVARAAARGGNILLNIGPMGTGKMDPKDLKILEGIGAWMKVNGDSIHGTTRSGLPVQSWGDTTRKGNTLYLHVMNWPRKGKIVVSGLKTPIKKATLLADPKKSLKLAKAGPMDMVVQGPESAPDATDTVIAAELEGDLSVDKLRAISTDTVEDTMRAFDGSISAGMKFGSGKVRDAYVEGWTRPEQSVSWQLRAREKATYDVSVVYDAEPKSVGGTFQVKLGSKVLPGTIEAGTAKVLSVGQAEVEPGRLELAVEPTKVNGPELMKLRGVILTLQGAEAPKKAVAGKAGGKKKRK